MAGTMSEQAVTYQQVTVAEAAAILGVSVMTVRRMIRRGQLEGERVHRPQGSAYVVKLPLDAPEGTAEATATEQPSENVSRTNGTAPAEAMVSLIQTTIGTVLGPLMAEQAALRQTVERQADQLVSQAETIGELRAENRALVARTAPQPVEPTAEASLSPGRVWWFWLVLLAPILATTIVVLVVLLAWPR